MHIPTHILSGWVVGNCFLLTPAQRLGCMIAASVADLDGLGIVGRPFGHADPYDLYHHVLGHNLPVCVIASVSLAGITARSRRAGVLVALLYAAIFHLHLLMDDYGSGPGWPIMYAWPFSDFKFVNWHAWELSSWQNSMTGLVLIAITVLIAWRARRTPLEVLYPSLDRKLVRQPAPPPTTPAP